MLAGLCGRATVSCDELDFVGFGAGVEVGDGTGDDLAGDSPRRNDSLDLEGPSLAATTPRLSKNFLYSYLAEGRGRSEYQQPRDALWGCFTSYIFLKFTVSFLLDHVRRWRVPGFIGIVDRVRLEVSHFSHNLWNS